jgi:trk system potassium uptake protein TrkA
VAKLEEASGARVAFLTRYGDGLLPTADTIVQDGDLVHVIAYTADTDRVAEVLALAPEVEI